MASNPLTPIPLKKSHGFHCHQLSERWQQIWERECIWGSCLALSHWNVFWPWWSNVMWEMDKQVESTPSETSHVESLLLKPTLRILVTWGWCYVRANLKVLVIRFFEVLPRFEIAILITRTNTKRDKPTFWRQLLPRKDDGIRLKSETYYLGIAKKTIGLLARDKNMDGLSWGKFSSSSSYHMSTCRKHQAKVKSKNSSLQLNRGSSMNAMLCVGACPQSLLTPHC